MLVHKKQKGSNFERDIAKDIAKTLDPHAKRMVLSGAVFGLETDIWTKLPFAFELKRHEKIKLYEFWNQAKLQAGYKAPVLVVKSSNKEELAIMNWKDWLELAYYALKSGYPDKA